MVQRIPHALVKGIDEHVVDDTEQLRVEIEQAGEDLGIAVTVVQGQSPAAVTIGVRSPRVYLTEGLVELLNTGELHAVLAHERQHASRRDPMFFGLVRAAAAAASVLPVARQWADRAVLEAEVMADRAAVEQTSLLDLARALTKLASSSDPSEAELAVGSVRGQLSARIAALSGSPMPPATSSASRRRSLVILLVISSPVLVLGAAVLRVYGVPWL